MSTILGINKSHTNSERRTCARSTRFGVRASVILLAFVLSPGTGNTGLTTEEKDYIIAASQGPPSMDLVVPFGYHSVRIEREDIEQLEELGFALEDPRLRKCVVQIAGHTGTEGDDAYELDLSKRRAEVIKRFLIENFSINPANLLAAGYGSSQLKDPGDPRADANRRVQIINLGAVNSGC